MPWNILILPLVAGYFICSRLEYLRFRNERYSQNRLIFECILAGFCCLMAAFAIKYILEILFPNFSHSIEELTPSYIKYLGTSVLSLILAILYTYGANFILTSEKVKRRNQRTINRDGNEMEILLASSLDKSKLLEFTLDTNKFYIGLVKVLPVPSVSKYVRIIPFFSGYRDDKMDLEFVTEYLSIYKDIINYPAQQTISDLDVDLVISFENIVHVSYFDMEVYEKFNVKKEVKMVDDKDQTPITSNPTNKLNDD